MIVGNIARFDYSREKHIIDKRLTFLKVRKTFEIYIYVRYQKIF